MPSASEQWLFNITWIFSPRNRDVLPVFRRMSFLPSVESPQEWSILRIMWSLLRIMWSFLPSCLRQPQEGRIIGPPHVVMSTLSIPRTCNPLFLTAVNSTFYEPTSVGRAGNADGLPQLRWQCWQRPDENLTTSPFLSHSYPNPRCRSSCRNDWPDDHLGFEYGLEQFCLLSYPRFWRTDQPKQRRFLSLILHLCKSETTHTISFRSKHPLSAVAVSSSSQRVIAMENLRSHVNTKLMLNDIKAAIRVVSSDDTVLEVTPEVLQALIRKHPSEPEDSVTPIIPAENIAVTADEKKIIWSLRSFSGGCCGGIDGLRPAHLLDLVAVSTAEAGLHLRRSITNMTNKILRGDVSDYAWNSFFNRISPLWRWKKAASDR